MNKMSARQNLSKGQKAAAWFNSGGNVKNMNEPIGEAACPWWNCCYGLMEANRYGDAHPSDWVVDHKIPLAKGGTNNQCNLQAMHNACNNEKGDS